ncbi:HalOD1 output domain-containing protein [Haloterrigena salinisoli]|uniref:HalOD1 output domain-containing protein n=1 Tax=Haloterrigena salinisoli TaxID=3132747 RepID=UPI0030CB7929
MSDRFGTVEFDAETRRYRARYDFETTAPSVAVADVLETVFDGERGREPLYDVIDPEAIDRLLEGGAERDRHGPRSVSFRYRGALVTVVSDGSIAVGLDDEIDR